MAVLWFDGLLARVADAGVYFLPEDDVDELLEAAAVNRFPCLRVNLAGCTGKADLLLRIAGVFAVPPHVVQDWDQLAPALERAQSLQPKFEKGQRRMAEYSIARAAEPASERQARAILAFARGEG